MNPVKVTIENFQSIEKLQFEIDGFTTITGKTNIGKSAIVRAISSCLLNLPVIGMIRAGASHVTVIIENGENTIKWEKGEKGINRYTINGILFDKVGGKQLPEIVKMGYSSVKVGSDEVYPWLATQFAPIFLLDKSGSQVSDFISEISRLQTIQNSINISSKGKRSYSIKSEDKRKEAEKESEELSVYSNVDLVETLEKDLALQKASIDEYSVKSDLAESIQSKLDANKKKVISLLAVGKVIIPDDYKDAQILCDMQEHSDKLKASVDKVVGIRKINEAIIPEFTEDVDQYKVALQHLNNVKRKKDALGSLSSVNIPEEISEVRSLHDMNKHLSEMSSHANSARSMMNDLETLKEKISSIEEEISNIPTCPTCKTPGLTHVAEAHTP